MCIGKFDNCFRATYLHFPILNLCSYAPSPLPIGICSIRSVPGVEEGWGVVSGLVERHVRCKCQAAGWLLRLPARMVRLLPVVPLAHEKAAPRFYVHSLYLHLKTVLFSSIVLLTSADCFSLTVPQITIRMLDLGVLGLWWILVWIFISGNLWLFVHSKSHYVQKYMHCHSPLHLVFLPFRLLLKWKGLFKV